LFLSTTRRAPPLRVAVLGDSRSPGEWDFKTASVAPGGVAWRNLLVRAVGRCAHSWLVALSRAVRLQGLRINCPLAGRQASEMGICCALTGRQASEIENMLLSRGSSGFRDDDMLVCWSLIAMYVRCIARRLQSAERCALRGRQGSWRCIARLQSDVLLGIAKQHSDVSSGFRAVFSWGSPGIIVAMCARQVPEGVLSLMAAARAMCSFPLLVFVRCIAPLFTMDTVHVQPGCGGGAVGSPRTSHVRAHPREHQQGVARQAPHSHSEVSPSGGLVPCGAGNKEGRGPSAIG
jgi:hypothetical protein